MMNYHTHFSFFCALLFIISCTSNRGVEGGSDLAPPTTQKTIKIELGQEWNYIHGLPIVNPSEEKFIELCLMSNEEEHLEVAKGMGVFTLINDTLSFNYRSADLQISGQFFIPPVPSVDYRTLYDPITFEARITPIVYYKPFRVGKWMKYQESAQQSKTFNISFLPIITDCTAH